ncbi:GDP-mannose 4,6-dehydratase [Naasia aerilata]
MMVESDLKALSASRGSVPAALVTGATGQDGSYLVEALLAAGWSVTALVHSQLESPNPLPGGVGTALGNLADADRLREVVLETAPDTIFNLGGLSSVAASWARPLDAARITGLSVAALLDAAWELQEQSGAPVRFLQASSAEIFGRAERAPQDESTPLAPVSPYGAAKAWAHTLVQVYRGRGLFAANAILYNHESTRRPLDFVTRKITHGVAEIATGSSDRLMLGNLEARRDWGWAPDYVDGMMRIAAAPEPDDFVLATGQAHSVAEFVAAAFAAVGIENWSDRVGIDERFNRPADATEQLGDASKAERVLGWRPKVPFQEIVARMTQHDVRLLTRGS